MNIVCLKVNLITSLIYLNITLHHKPYDELLFTWVKKCFMKLNSNLWVTFIVITSYYILDLLFYSFFSSNYKSVGIEDPIYVKSIFVVAGLVYLQLVGMDLLTSIILSFYFLQ